MASRSIDMQCWKCGSELIEKGDRFIFQQKVNMYAFIG